MIASVDVQVATERVEVPSDEDISLWVERAMGIAGANKVVEVAVRIVGHEEMQQLNSDFREQDKATNVLSFPAGDIKGLPDDAERPLGDIVVCAAVVSEEAAQQGKSVNDHWAHMIVHGTLHLLGYDHVDTADAEVMERLETQVLGDNGIADPYGESREKT